MCQKANCVSLLLYEVKLQRCKRAYFCHIHNWCQTTRTNQPSQPPTDKYVSRDSMAFIMCIGVRVEWKPLYYAYQRRHGAHIVSAAAFDKIVVSRRHSSLHWQSYYTHPQIQFRSTTHSQLRRACPHCNRTYTNTGARLIWLVVQPVEWMECKRLPISKACAIPQTLQ